ncbi:SAM-dependent methyltransferase [Catenuloplanes japonicus]|uniref:SAM-dependent methyltransferase n=1 Tax=Catenuloplanes japonicus TaxID=33876 RepID=UPI000524D69A|nr:SAM-dependent methyltransferase [Catenuloplanes japonicus]
MSELPDWVPSGVDVSVPNAARIHDYALGGHHHFAIDREHWRLAETAVPDARLITYAQRGFLGRAVRWLAGRGVRQFLDIGSGLPTLGNVHEVARDADPAARVVYVDNDPVTVVQSRALLEHEPRARAVEGDLRRPEDILYHPEVLELLDFSEPVAVLMLDVLRFVAGPDRPGEIVRRFGEACVSGSYLVVSHTVLRLPGESAAGRTAGEITAMLDDLAIVDPGVVPATDWHPDPLIDETSQPGALVAVARKS